MTEIPGMVERVARALFEDFYKGYLRPQMSWEERPAVVREYWIRKTAIAIAAHEAALRDAGMVIVPTWQPIESAPKDGTPILLLSKAYSDPGDPANGLEAVHHPARCSIGVWWPEGDSWTDQYGSLESGDICQLTVTGVWSSGGGWFQPNEVTYWMPLPAVPSTAPINPNN